MTTPAPFLTPRLAPAAHSSSTGVSAGPPNPSPPPGPHCVTYAMINYMPPYTSMHRRIPFEWPFTLPPFDWCYQAWNAVPHRSPTARASPGDPRAAGKMRTIRPYISHLRPTASAPTTTALGVKATNQASMRAIVDVTVSVPTLTLLSPPTCGMIHSVLHVSRVTLSHLRPVPTSVSRAPILARTCVWSIWAWTLVCIRVCATTAAAYTALKATAHRGCRRAVWQEWAAHRRHARARRTTCSGAQWARAAAALSYLLRARTLRIIMFSAACLVGCEAVTPGSPPKSPPHSPAIAAASSHRRARIKFEFHV